MKKISLLTCSAALLWPLSLSAQTCTTPPSCDTLGYKQSASDCSGQQMLKCPFDNSKVFCGGATCPDDFKLTNCSSAIGTVVNCGSKCKYTACIKEKGWKLVDNNCIADWASCPALDPKCRTPFVAGTDNEKYAKMMGPVDYCWVQGIYYVYNTSCFSENALLIAGHCDNSDMKGCDL